MQLECHTEQRRCRSQRDIAFFPSQADTQHILLSGKFSMAHHAIIRDRTGIRTSERAGERKARHFQPLRQAMQIFFLLLGGAVVQQQLAGPREFGTITVTAAVPLREATLLTTAECACAENSSPPYILGMIMPKNPLSLMNCQTSGGKSARWW